MKKYLMLSYLLLWASSALFAKNEFADIAQPANNLTIPCPKAYIGLGVGINNPNGLFGFSFEVPVLDVLSFSAGAGAAIWGTSVCGEFRYYMVPCQRGWSLAMGISHNSGRTNFKPRQNFNTIAGPEPIALNLHSMNNAYFAVQRSWNMGKKRNKLFAQLGWSVPLKPSSFKQLSGSALTPQEGDRISAWAPGNTLGGLLIGGGIYFGIH